MISGFGGAGPGPGTRLSALAGHSAPAALCYLQAVTSGHSKASAAFLPASSMIVEPPTPGQANQNYHQDWEGAGTRQISLDLPISICLLLLGPA